jgi:hypothetical protein
MGSFEEGHLLWWICVLKYPVELVVKRFVAVLMLAGGLLVTGGAHATVAVTFTQVGSDVVATAVGTLNLPGATSPGTGLNGLVDPNNGFIYFANNSSFDSIFCLVGPAYGTGGGLSPSSFSGSVFGIWSSNNLVFLPAGYQSGDPISSSITLPNITVASLGLTAGGTTYTCGADTITVGVSAPAPPVNPIPTLAEWAQIMMMLALIATAGFYGRRRRI